MFGIPGLTIENIVIALIAAAAGFAFRDLPNKGVSWFRGRYADKEEWRNRSREYLERLIQIGTSIQASSEIEEKEIRRVSDRSEEFAGKVSPRPKGIEEDVYWEVKTISDYSGFLPSLIRELDESKSIGDAMETFFNFRRRMAMENFHFDEVLENSPDSEKEKIMSRLMMTYKRSRMSLQDQMDVTVRLLNEFGLEDMSDLDDFDLSELSFDDLEEIPWEDIFEAIDSDAQEKFVSDVKRDIIGVYLIEVPEEAIEMIDERS